MVRARRGSVLGVFAAISLFGFAAAGLAAPTFPALTGRVVDEAGIIPPAAETEIEGKLAALEAKTTDQFVVVTLPSLQGYDIADFGYQLGRHWAIGQADRDNGVLLIVAPNERAVRIEVGYGLEGDLTDAVTRIIIENAIIPRFREDDMAGGIVAGVDDVLKVLTGEGAEIQELVQRQSEEDEGDDPMMMIAIFLAIWVAFLLLAHLRRRKGRWVWVAGSGSSSGSSSGWSSGGSSGGFSGGGGSFGGGGSSGRW